MGSGHLEEGVTDVAPSNHRQNWAPILSVLILCAVCVPQVCVCVCFFFFFLKSRSPSVQIDWNSLPGLLPKDDPEHLILPSLPKC